MKMFCLATAALFLCLASTGLSAEKESKASPKGTCCEMAFAEGKECSHRCCVAAHKADKSCQKCNPGKEDLAARKKKKK